MQQHMALAGWVVMMSLTCCSDQDCSLWSVCVCNGSGSGILRWQEGKQGCDAQAVRKVRGCQLHLENRFQQLCTLSRSL